MSQIVNVYCDESCHLESDGQPAMVLGAVWCPLDKRLEITTRLREIKQRHCLPADFEVKWSKVSKSKLSFYLDVLDDRGDYILPWTAFFIEHDHQRRKYNRRWERYGNY